MGELDYSDAFMLRVNLEKQTKDNISTKIVATFFIAFRARIPWALGKDNGHLSAKRCKMQMET